MLYSAFIHLDLPESFAVARIQEGYELCEACEVFPFVSFRFRRTMPDAQHFLGPGQLTHVERALKASPCVEQVIVHHNLSAQQKRNMSRFLKREVLDRNEIILAIFAKRAQTNVGKLQVELAQLAYLSTRLVRGWTHLERQKGGIGLRGPGETQLETDRRLIANRIKSIKKRLEKSHRQKKLNRYARKKGNNHVLALVGYTNAGKTTLFNKLTGSDFLIIIAPNE